MFVYFLVLKIQIFRLIRYKIIHKIWRGWGTGGFNFGKLGQLKMKLLSSIEKKKRKKNIQSFTETYLILKQKELDSFPSVVRVFKFCACAASYIAVVTNLKLKSQTENDSKNSFHPLQQVFGLPEKGPAGIWYSTVENGPGWSKHGKDCIYVYCISCTAFV